MGTDRPDIFSALPLSHLAAAPRYVVLNAILKDGGVSPDVVANSIGYSRRMMKESLHWSDSHSFSMMLSKSLIAAYMAMGFLHLSLD
ncbi:MAG TPA: hypothetical protein DCM54_01190 [Gammaproteobacteria bacterium]|nr:hypothetical protein [Gammaproteobacteria bacterium]